MFMRRWLAVRAEFPNYPDLDFGERLDYQEKYMNTNRWLF